MQPDEVAGVLTYRSRLVIAHDGEVPLFRRVQRERLDGKRIILSATIILVGYVQIKFAIGKKASRVVVFQAYAECVRRFVKS